MTWDVDADAEAGVVLERAGFANHQTPGALALAKGLEIEVKKYPNHSLRGLDARLFWPRGRACKPQIAIRHGLSPTRKAWCIAHELGEQRLKEIGYEGGDIEQVANAVAAALLMPRVTFREVVRDVGENLAALAGDFAIEQTAAALRLAETGCREASVVVCPHKTYARVFGGYELPCVDELRRLARTTAGVPGLRKVAITDAHKRFALVA